MKKPTQKELEQIEKAKSTLKSILSVHMREPFSDNEFEILLSNMKKLKKMSVIYNGQRKLLVLFIMMEESY